MGSGLPRYFHVSAHDSRQVLTFQGNSHLSRHLPAPQQSVFSDTSLHNFRYGIDCDASEVQE